MRRGSIALMVVLATLGVACGDPSAGPGSGLVSTLAPSTTTPGSPPEHYHTGGELGIIVAPGRDGTWPPDLIVGCSTGPTLQMSDLEEVQPLETAGLSGVAEAIEPFLSSEEGAFWPQEDWLVLRAGDDEVLLVARADEGLAFMSVQQADGEWVWSGSSSGGPCPLQYQVPEGLNSVDWRLDPSSSPPGPDSTEIDVLVTERNCVGGIEVGERLLGPEIVMTGDSVRIAFAAQPPPGDAFDCQGNPETPHRVILPAPLGERQIVEGLAIGIDLEDYLP